MTSLDTIIRRNPATSTWSKIKNTSRSVLAGALLLGGSFGIGGGYIASLGFSGGLDDAIHKAAVHVLPETKDAYIYEAYGGTNDSTDGLTPLPESLPEGPPRITIKNSMSGPDKNIFFNEQVYPNYEYSSLDELTRKSPHGVAAALCAEDQLFFYHDGVNPIRFSQSIFDSMTSLIGLKDKVPGRSSISQQVIDSVVNGVERDGVRGVGSSQTSIYEKIYETVLAERAIEKYGHQEVLETYLNFIPGPHNSIGLEACTVNTFGKALEEASPKEAIACVASTRRPEDTVDPNSSLVDQIYEQIQEKQFIQPRLDFNLSDENRVFLNKLSSSLETFTPSNSRSSDAQPDDTYWFLHEASKEVRALNLDPGVYTVSTSIHPEMQRDIIASVDSFTSTRGLETDHYQGAVLAVDNNGYIRGFHDTKDPNQSEFSLLNGEHPPGSTLKPLMIQSIFESLDIYDVLGNPFDVLEVRDVSPTSYVYYRSRFMTEEAVDVVRRYGKYIPDNWNGTNQGRIMLRDGLLQSLNASMFNFGIESFSVKNQRDSTSFEAYMNQHINYLEGRGIQGFVNEGTVTDARPMVFMGVTMNGVNVPGLVDNYMAMGEEAILQSTILNKVTQTYPEMREYRVRPDTIKRLSESEIRAGRDVREVLEGITRSSGYVLRDVSGVDRLYGKTGTQYNAISMIGVAEENNDTFHNETGKIAYGAFWRRTDGQKIDLNSPSLGYVIRPMIERSSEYQGDFPRSSWTQNSHVYRPESFEYYYGQEAPGLVEDLFHSLGDE